MKKIACLLVLVCLALPAPSALAEYTWNELKWMDEVASSNYILGSFDGLLCLASVLSPEMAVLFDAFDEMSNDQVVEEFERYIDAHQEMWHAQIQIPLLQMLFEFNAKDLKEFMLRNYQNG